ncbi:MAG: cupredoxin domain-containing protein [bacterium]
MRRHAGPVALALLLVGPLAVILAAATPPTVQIKAEEFRFTPKDVTLRPGEVIFSVKNDGAIEHNFAIEDSTGKKVAGIASILPEKTDQLRVTLRPGKFVIVCDLPGHKDAGMRGTLTIQE